MIRIVLLLALLSVSYCLSAQPHVILDTDIDSDVDDVEALAMLHRMADQKLISFDGVIVTSDDPDSPACTAAINGWYKRPDLPVGCLRSKGAPQAPSRYAHHIAEKFSTGPKVPADFEDATDVYRRLLAAAPDGSAVIITIGHLTNLRGLLQSKSDQLSPLTGEELVHRKVSKWLCMGGQFPLGKEHNFCLPDPASTVYCLSQWKKPVIFAGWEVGEKIITGGAYLKSRMSEESPVYLAYQLYNNFKGRSSWDQVAVFMLLEESRQYFDVISGGFCKVTADGSNEWVSGKKSNHAYVALRKDADLEKIARIMDDMVLDH